MEKKDKKFNPTLASGFENAKFGEGSIKFEVTAETIKTFQENVELGSSLLVRFNKVSSFGNKHYFMEILPPYEKRASAKGTKAKPAATELD